MIRMIIGWTMIGGGRNEAVHVHSVHSIREIKAPYVPDGVVPDGGRLRDSLLPKLMRDEVRVK